MPDSLPRVVACYLPASKCFLWPAPYDVAHQARSIVAEQYEFVIGVDTRAATYTLAVITAATGAVIDQAVFWTTPSGLDRARTWITRYVDEHAALVVMEGVGSYGAGLTGRVVNAGLTVVEPASIAAARCR